MSGGPARVLLVSHRADATGAPKSLAVLASRLDRRRYHPALAAPGEGPLLSGVPPDVPAYVLARGRFASIGLRTVARFRTRDWPGFARAQTVYVAGLARLARRNADIVHVNTVEEPFAALAARLARRPVIWHVHETLPDTAPARLVARLVFRLAARVVAVSDHTARTLTRLAGRPPDACLTIHNGIDSETMTPTRSRDEVRAALNLPPDAVVLLSIGSAGPHKGQHVLFEAVGRLGGTRPGVVTLVAGSLGSSPYADQLRVLAGESALGSRLRLLGHRTDIPDLMAAADVVVVPSLVDSLPWVVLEAMAAGRPVVASDVCGIGEMVRHEETGLLVPPADVAALVAVLDRLAADPGLCDRLGSAGRARVVRSFAETTFVKRFEALYDDLLAARAPVA